jgi:hypothetical protein
MTPAPRSLFAGLVDDAALFPPGNAPMDVGLREHARHRAASYGDIVGPFLCPASRVDEMLALLPDDQHLQLSLVVDGTGEATHAALRSVGKDRRLTLVAVEAAAARLGADVPAVGANLRKRKQRNVIGYLEVPRTDFDAKLELVGEGGWHAAKYRTGGVRDEDVPDELELAAFLIECVRRGLPFKLTAGLHHAVAEGLDANGPGHHGVLNVLAAVAAAQAGADHGLVSGILATPAASSLASDVSRWSDDLCAQVRSALRSFGCCGVTDPIGELAELGLIEEPRP